MIDKDKEQTDEKLVQPSFDSESNSIFTNEASSSNDELVEQARSSAINERTGEKKMIVSESEQQNLFQTSTIVIPEVDSDKDGLSNYKEEGFFGLKILK